MCHRTSIDFIKSLLTVGCSICKYTLGIESDHPNGNNYPWENEQSKLGMFSRSLPSPHWDNTHQLGRSRQAGVGTLTARVVITLPSIWEVNCIIQLTIQIPPLPKQRPI